MGARTHDIFGDGGGAHAATPGSYGEAPPGFRLPEETSLGPVHLQIADLTRSLAFYEQVLGLLAIERGESHAVLGAQGGDAALVVLREHTTARPAPRRGRLGLYHFAILLPDRSSLGRFVRHLGEINVRAGSADHLVSEAVYLEDPDNLGIEVYADRPRQSWRRVRRELMMATDPIDTAGLLLAAGARPWEGMPAGTVIGHVHLHVGNIERAAAFFSDAIGFDRMVWHYPGALFLGAGGYHHHLGTNTWAGEHATPPGETDARLLEWTVVVPDDASVERIAASLEAAGFAANRATNAGGARQLVTRDPWGTQLRIVVSGGTGLGDP